MWGSPRNDVARGYAKRTPGGVLIQFNRNKLKDIDDRTHLQVDLIDSTHMASPSYRERLYNGQGTINKGRSSRGLAHDY